MTNVQNQQRISLRDIEAAVCSHFTGLQLQHLQSRTKKNSVAFPRFVAIHFARAHTPWSLPQLGERYHRDHTTILHGQRRAVALMATNEKFADDVAAVAELLHTRPRNMDELARLAAGPLVRHVGPTPAAIAVTWC